VTADTRLEHLLTNIRIREELVRRQLTNIGLRDVILTELEASHRMPVARS
jgi:hypothetical protein